LQRVARELQPHVHLLSSHRFPQIASLGLEQAYRYLIDAPSIVKQIAPMSWNYIAAPPDGSVWLEWISLDMTDHPYPSDGYIWGDIEQSYRQEFAGYTIELRVQGLGYRPGLDHMATHARTRYHLVAKNPQLSSPPPDPSLWIVHYHSANPNQIMPSAQVPVSPQMQQIITQRRWLESQGRLERREFMLHDREHWAPLNIPPPPQMQPPGPYGATLAGVPGRPPYQHPTGQPPAKKPRTAGPGMAAPGPNEGPVESSTEYEEDTMAGDFFDYLTQREISLARYTQHHRWMEEVLSSPYATHQIVPPDLGLGLMGELKSLTDGILQPPIIDPRETEPRPMKTKELRPFTNLKQEQVEEFNKRVAKHLEEGQAEIERMKADHAAKMQDWRKFTQVEKRLRHAPWRDSGEAVHAYRLDPAVNGSAEDGQEYVEDIVKEVEEMLNAKITSHPDAERIARGGLQDRKQPTFFEHRPMQQDQANEVQEPQQPPEPQSEQQQQQQPPNLGGSGINTTNAGMYHEDPMSHATAEQSGPKAVSQPQHTHQSSSNQQTPNPTDSTPQTGAQGNNGNDVSQNTPGMDINDMMDVDEPIDFGGISPAQDPPSGTTTSDRPDTDQAPSSGKDTSTAPVQSQAESKPPPPPEQPVPQPNASAPGADSNPNQDTTTGGDTNMFNDTFDDLGNIDGNADDGLIDFEGGDLGLDDSAFGDALHGMDAPEGSGSGNTS
jgi:hypothetical protein